MLFSCLYSLLQSESVPPVSSPSLIKSSEYISPVSLLRSEREYYVRKPLRHSNDKCHRAQLPGDGGGGGDASLWTDWCHRQVSDIRMSIELRKEESPGGFFIFLAPTTGAQEVTLSVCVCVSVCDNVEFFTLSSLCRSRKYFVLFSIGIPYS